LTELGTPATSANTPARRGVPHDERESRVLLQEARRALAEAEDLPALATLVARADVMRVAARKATLSEEACLDWEEFSLDAQREAGSVLAGMDKHAGGRPAKTPDIVSGVSEPKLEDLGISHKQSSRWQAVASLSNEDYEDYKTKARAKGEITRAGAIKRAKQVHAAQASPEPAVIPAGLFSTIVADPPWRYGNTSTRAAAQNHYDTLSIAQLCGEEEMPPGSPVRSLTKEVVHPKVADRAHLYLWTTASHLPEAFRVMESWGFTYKTYLVWVKPQMGMGNYFRVSTELVLFGIRGEMRTQHMGLMNYFTVGRGKHSSKPTEFYDLVARASPGPWLEIFARCDAGNQLSGTCQCSRCRLGWEVWGNQA